MASIFIGIYSWLVADTGGGDGHKELAQKAFSSEVLVFVGKSPVYYRDIEWAYKFSVLGLNDRDDLSFFPEVGDRLHELLAPLKDRLVAGLIERKLLFEFIRASGEMDLERPELYTNCLEEWRLATRDRPPGDPLLSTSEDKERLKRRICEWDIVKNYLAKEVFGRIKVDDKEMSEYFQAHRGEFRKRRRVVIQQIVLASEREASKVRNIAKSHNFGKLAEKYSITPEASQQGRVGPFAKGEMPRIFNVAFSMRVGEIRGVLKSTYGFHIIKLEKKLPRHEPNLTDVAGLIRRRIRKQKEEKEYQKWLELALNTVAVESPKPLW